MISSIKSFYLRYRFWIHDFLYRGGEILKIYREIAYFDTHSPEQCKEKLQKALAHILKHAVTHSPFYASAIKPGIV